MSRSIAFFFLVLLLGACSASVQQASTSTPTAPQSTKANVTQNLSRTDEQGAVVVKITLLNLDTVNKTLDFEVAMDTHSVDLSMDLAKLAVLTTDAGATIQPIRWDAPNGGHHVTGKLSFPASTNNIPLLGKTTVLTLTLRDVDAAERIFKWDLSQ